MISREQLTTIFEQNKLKILERSSASKLLFSAKKLLNNNSEISKILVARTLCTGKRVTINGDI